MRRIALTILAALLILTLAACADVPAARSITAETGLTRIEGLTIDHGLTRFEDAEAGVVCWIYKTLTVDGVGAGISCLPIGETRLREATP